MPKRLFYSIHSYYSWSVFILYCFFLFCVLSIGRAFSVVHINTPWLPLYSTELFLGAAFASIITGIKSLYKQYKSFFIVLLVYFFLGCAHLFVGFKHGNFYAFRDFILCLYALFVPLTMLIFSSKDRIRLFIKLIIAGNIAALIAGRFYLIGSNYSGFFQFIGAQARATSFGIGYCFSLCFLLILFDNFHQRWQRFLASILISLNIYMLFLLGKRAMWLALLILCIYFLAVLRKKFLIISFRILPFFIMIASLFCFLDFNFLTLPEQKKTIVVKLKATQFYIANKLFFKKGIRFEEKAILEKIGDHDIEGSYFDIIWRPEIWRQAIVYGLDSPLLGRGFGNYPNYVVHGNMHPRPRSCATDSGIIPAHNQFVTIFYKMGFVGLFLFLFLNGYILFSGISQAWREKDTLTKAYLFGLIGCFLAWHTIAFTFDVIESPPTSIFLWVIMGCILSAVGIHEQKIVTA